MTILVLQYIKTVKDMFSLLYDLSDYLLVIITINEWIANLNANLNGAIWAPQITFTAIFFVSRDINSSHCEYPLFTSRLRVCCCFEFHLSRDTFRER